MACNCYCVHTDIDPGVTSSGVGPDFIDIEWNNQGLGIIQRVLISAQYSAPCSDVTLPLVTAVLDNPTSNSYMISNLEEFSTYRINVTIVSDRGVGTDVVMAETTGTG